MKYLLIDFGASFIKCIVYDSEKKEFTKYKEYESPFLKQDTLDKNNLILILKNIFNDYKKIKFICSCSIKNGIYENDIYKSWKVLNKNQFDGNNCLISELFKSQDAYHIHNDHNIKSNIMGLSILGTMDEKIFLSNLGDTNCVYRSIGLDEDEIVLNLGTGSQIIYKDKTISFFPSGRMFNIYQSFFNEFNVNLFDKMSKIDTEMIEDSSLDFNLNIFEQSINFSHYGSINNIKENNFNFDNFVSSLLRSYIEQYIPYIEKNIKTIYLTGGIAHKIPVIQKYLFKHLNINVTLLDSKLNATHLGLANMINQYEKNINHRL